MGKYIGINSLVKIRIKETGKVGVCKLVLKSEKNNEVSINTPLGEALIWHCVRDIVFVKEQGDNKGKGYEIEILDIKNPVSIKKYYENKYGDIERKIKSLSNDDITIFPFEEKLYIGNLEKYKCRCGYGRWEVIEMVCFYKNGAEIRTIYCCKNCKKSVLNSLPHKEERLYDFYQVYDLGDGEQLNKKKKEDLAQMQVQYYHSLVIQGGSFTGK